MSPAAQKRKGEQIVAIYPYNEGRTILARGYKLPQTFTVSDFCNDRHSLLHSIQLRRCFVELHLFGQHHKEVFIREYVEGVDEPAYYRP